MLATPIIAMLRPPVSTVNDKSAELGLGLEFFSDVLEGRRRVKAREVSDDPKHTSASYGAALKAACGLCGSTDGDFVIYVEYLKKTLSTICENKPFEVADLVHLRLFFEHLR